MKKRKTQPQAKLQEEERYIGLVILPFIPRITERLKRLLKNIISLSKLHIDDLTPSHNFPFMSPAFHLYSYALSKINVQQSVKLLAVSVVSKPSPKIRMYWKQTTCTVRSH